MSKTKTGDLSADAFAEPSARDIAAFERLSEVERAALIKREVERGMASGLTETTSDRIWAEAKRRVAAKAKKPNAV